MANSQAKQARLKLETLLGRCDIDEFFDKLEVHLLRLFTPEFLHTNMKQQHGDQDNQLLSAYFKSLFSLEIIKGCLKTTSNSNSLESFLPACNLLVSLDALSHDNKDATELMHKPYLRLVNFAFPYAIRLFAEQTRVAKDSKQASVLRRLLVSPLASFV